MTIEILMATYNGEKYLPEQIESILNQTDHDWHLTISDDGSTDGTINILNKYEKKYSSKMTIIHSDRQFGNPRDHFFYLLEECNAEWIMFCDQDDTWYPAKIELFRKEIIKLEQHYGTNIPILVFSDQTPTDAALKPLAKSLMSYQKQYVKHFDYRSILMQNVVTGGAMMINQKLAILGSKCKDRSSVVMHDWWLAAVAAYFGRIIYINAPSGTYRQHMNNSIGAKNVSNIKYILNQFHTNFYERMLRKKQQAYCFLKTYSSDLNYQDIFFLKGFIKRHSGLLFYLRRYHEIHGIFRFVGFIIYG